jgi:hypothetical protein
MARQPGKRSIHCQYISNVPVFDTSRRAPGGYADPQDSIAKGN